VPLGDWLAPLPALGENVEVLPPFVSLFTVAQAPSRNASAIEAQMSGIKDF
jgi:hypothetical protein